MYTLSITMFLAICKMKKKMCKSNAALELPLLSLYPFFALCNSRIHQGLLRLPGFLYWHRKSIRLTFRLMSSASARLLPVTHSALVWTGGCGFPFTTGPQPWCLQVCTPVTLHAFESASEWNGPPIQNNRASSAHIHYLTWLEVLLHDKLC